MSQQQLAGTKTHQNLKAAFQAEAMANLRYLHFAKIADVEGHPDLSSLFKYTADIETGHAHGHLDYLKPAGDPTTGLPFGDSVKSLKCAIAGETTEYESMYKNMVKDARAEGFDDIAEWFEKLVEAEKSNANRFKQLLAMIDI